jgi:hypothetical protein
LVILHWIYSCLTVFTGVFMRGLKGLHDLK